MSSTAAITISGSVTGLPQGTEAISITMTNSTAVGGHIYSTLSSAGEAKTGFSFLPPPDTRFLFVIPPTTNAQTLRIGVSSSTVVDGLPLSSQGASVITVGTTGTTYWLWSTGAAAVNGVQLSFY